MNDYPGLTTLLILAALVAVVMLPTIAAFWTDHRYKWFILIANLFIPAAPPSWLALLLGTVLSGRKK